MIIRFTWVEQKEVFSLSAHVPKSCLCLFHISHHLVDATSLLLFIRMNIKVKRSTNIGMSQKNTHSLVIAMTLNTASSKTVA